MARVTSPIHPSRAYGPLSKTTATLDAPYHIARRAKLSQHDPRTAAQISIRGLSQFLARQWWTFPQEQRDNWASEWEAGYHRYAGYNFTRWHNGGTPFEKLPALSESPANVISAFSASGNRRFASIAIASNPNSYAWGLILYRSNSADFTPGEHNAILFLPYPFAAAWTYTDSPLSRGTYYYSARIFNRDGTIGPLAATAAAVVF